MIYVFRESQSRWARASTAERRAHPDNKKLEAFFRNNGIEDRSFDPSIKEAELPADATSDSFAGKVEAAHAKLSAAAGIDIGTGVFPGVDDATYGSFGIVSDRPTHIHQLYAAAHAM